PAAHFFRSAALAGRGLVCAHVVTRLRVLAASVRIVIRPARAGVDVRADVRTGIAQVAAGQDRLAVYSCNYDYMLAGPRLALTVRCQRNRTLRTRNARLGCATGEPLPGRRAPARPESPCPAGEPLPGRRAMPKEHRRGRRIAA